MTKRRCIVGLLLGNDSTRRCSPTWWSSLMCNTGSFFMAGSRQTNTSVQHRQTPIKQARRTKSSGSLWWMEVACRKRKRRRMNVQMLDTSVLTKQVMWRPWRWRSLWYIAVFSVFSCSRSAVRTGERHRDLLPANYRGIQPAHAVSAAHWGSDGLERDWLKTARKRQKHKETK